MASGDATFRNQSGVLGVHGVVGTVGATVGGTVSTSVGVGDTGPQSALTEGAGIVSSATGLFASLGGIRGAGIGTVRLSISSLSNLSRKTENLCWAYISTNSCLSAYVMDRLLSTAESFSAEMLPVPFGP